MDYSLANCVNHSGVSGTYRKFFTGEPLPFPEFIDCSREMRKDFFRNTSVCEILLLAENLTSNSVRLLARINSILGVEN